MRTLDELAARLSRGTISIILRREQRVCKELFAQRIHRRSPRAGHPFVRLNCAAFHPCAARERAVRAGSAVVHLLQEQAAEAADGGNGNFLGRGGRAHALRAGQAPSRSRGAERAPGCAELDGRYGSRVAGPANSDLKSPAWQLDVSVGVAAASSSTAPTISILPCAIAVPISSRRLTLFASRARRTARRSIVHSPPKPKPDSNPAGRGTFGSCETPSTAVSGAIKSTRALPLQRLGQLPRRAAAPGLLLLQGTTQQPLGTRDMDATAPQAPAKRVSDVCGQMLRGISRGTLLARRVRRAGALAVAAVSITGPAPREGGSTGGHPFASVCVCIRHTSHGRALRLVGSIHACLESSATTHQRWLLNARLRRG